MITLSVITLSKFHCNTFVFFSTYQPRWVFVPNYSFVPNVCLRSFPYCYQPVIVISFSLVTKLSHKATSIVIYICTYFSTDQPRWVFVPNNSFIPNVHLRSFLYYYQLVIVISLSLTESDHIKQILLLYTFLFF